MSNGQELLRTGEVARLLGCSRQHVVDLCNDGTLPYQSTGKHRRISREHVDALLSSRMSEMRREEARSLWLNRAISGKLAQRPDRVLRLARRNLARSREVHAGSSVMHWLKEWDRTLDKGPDLVMRILASETPHARDLRQNSPFAGVLSEKERRDVLNSFTRYWQRRAG